MGRTERLWGLLCACITAFAGLALLLSGVAHDAEAQDSGTITGIVIAAQEPIPGATVRVRATENVTYTDDNGRFTLTGLNDGEEIEVTAWSDGYYIASAHVTPSVWVTLTLRPLHTTDHPDYVWTSPISGTAPGACGNCHPMIISQWINNGHGTAVSNARFFSLYNGTNLSGTTAIGPGYLHDFPDTAGNCASCHAPGLGVDGYLTTNMNDARDVITAGIQCDYCHKVGDVYLNPATGSVYANAPGTASQQLLRPPAGDDIFIGPYDDIPDPDTYDPLFTQSQFCAPCHQFSFWGTPIYESYEEWLHSPYADAGVTCQDCHMPPNGDDHFALPEKGGLPHPPETIPSHLQLGATDTNLLQNAVMMTLSARQNGRSLEVAVTITNTGAGHHIPTDHPGRHLILTVEVMDESGQPLSLQGGQTVPAWGGEQAGKPGIVYAKLLADALTGEAPVVSYWKQTFIADDNRIPALQSDETLYNFALPTSETVLVKAELRFRRVFQPLMDDKGWTEADIFMAEAQVKINTKEMWAIYLPFINSKE